MNLHKNRVPKTMTTDTATLKGHAALLSVTVPAHQPARSDLSSDAKRRDGAMPAEALAVVLQNRPELFQESVDSFLLARYGSQKALRQAHKIDLFLKHSADPYEFSGKGEPALVSAIRSERPWLFKKLLSRMNFNLPVAQKTGQVTMEAALWAHNGDAVDALLAKGVRVTNERLQDAALCGNELGLQKLLQGRADLPLTERKRLEGIVRSQVRCIEKLYDSSAPKCDFFEFLRGLSRHSRQETVLRRLCVADQAGLNLSILRDGHGYTPLMVMAMKGYSPTFQTFLDSRLMNPNIGVRKSDTPGTLAVKVGDLSILEALIDTGWLEVNQKTGELEETMLALATRLNEPDMCQLLLDAGADENQPDRNGQTPVHHAAKDDRLQIFQQFIASGRARLDAIDHRGNTPAHDAARLGQPKALQALIQSGRVNLNARNYQGKTPLTLAVLRSQIPVVCLLIDSGKIDVSARVDEAGNTLAIWAAANNLPEVLQALQKAGVDLSIGKQGYTPLLAACKLGCSEALQVLAYCKQVDLNEAFDYSPSKGLNPVSMALAHRNHAMLQILLDSGKVDLNQSIRCNIGGIVQNCTPLQLARELKDPVAEQKLRLAEQMLRATTRV